MILVSVCEFVLVSCSTHFFLFWCAFWRFSRAGIKGFCYTLQSNTSFTELVQKFMSALECNRVVFNFCLPFSTVQSRAHFCALQTAFCRSRIVLSHQRHGVLDSVRRAGLCPFAQNFVSRSTSIGGAVWQPDLVRRLVRHSARWCAASRVRAARAGKLNLAFFDRRHACYLQLSDRLQCVRVPNSAEHAAARLRLRYW